MHTDKRRKDFFQQFSPRPGQPRSLLQKIVTVAIAAGVFALALMFSVVVFALVLTVGVVAWGYLWWKSRDLRRKMRENPPGGLVIEGEVIREVKTPRDEPER